MVQFYPWYSLKFSFVLVYDNIYYVYETKENSNCTKGNFELQHKHYAHGFVDNTLGTINFKYCLI